MKKILLLMAFTILFTTMPLAQDYVAKPPWFIDENVYIKGMCWVDSNLVPSRDCHWYLGVDTLRWKSYICTLWCDVAFFDQLGLNCADSGKIDTSYFEDIWVDTVHSCSSVLVIDNDTTFFDGNGNDAKIVQFCELLDAANTENAFLCSTLTDAGSNANIRRAFKAILIDGGFTGNNQTYAGYFYNSAGGTGAVARNYGALGYAVYASATGNYGLKGVSENAAVNVGVYGQSIDDVASADNFGLLGIAKNDGAGGFHCAGYFDLGDGTLPNLTFSSTIIGNNTNYTDNHLTLMDDLYPVFVVADNGDSAGILYVIDNTSDTTIITPSSITSDSLIMVTGNDSMLFPLGDTTLQVIARRNSATDIYGLNVRTHNAGAGINYGGRFYVAPEGTGIRYGIYTRAMGTEAGVNDIYGIYGIGEVTTGTTSTSKLYGGFFYARSCGIGKKHGVYGKAIVNPSPNDSIYGVYGYADALNADTDKPSFGGHFVAVGDANDTIIGVYGKASGGAINLGGVFDPLVWVLTGTDTTKIRGTAVESDSGIFGVLDVTTIVVDSIDAQHGVFDISLWADSIYCNHLVNNVSAIFNAYLDADSVHANHIVSDGQVSADSIHGDHGVFTVHVNTDSIYSVHLVNTTSGLFQGYVDADSLHGDHIVSDNQVVGDSLYGDHVVANVELIADSVYAQHGVFAVHINTDSIYTEHLVCNATGLFNAWISCDSIEADHGYFQVHVNTDSIYCEHLVNNISGLFNAYVDADSVHGDHIVSDNQVVGDSLYGDHVVANVELIADSVNAVHGVFSVHVNTDSIYCEHLVNNAGGVFNANIVGTASAGEIQWDGFVWHLDYDSDDSLGIITFDRLEGDTLRSDTISHILTWTGTGGFLGMDAPAGADSFRLFDDGDTCHWSSDNPHKISANTAIQGDLTIRGNVLCDSLIQHSINVQSGHIANGTVPTDGTPSVELATAGVTYFDGTPNLTTTFGTPQYVDSVGIYYRVPADDTIDLIQWGSLLVTNIGLNVKLDDDTDIEGGLGINGLVVLKDSSIYCQQNAYRVDITTKGLGGSEIDRIVIFSSQ